MKKLKYMIGKIIVFVFKIFPVKKNLIYFISNDGKRFADNPKVFFEYMYENYHDKYNFYYCLNDKTSINLPSDVKTAKMKSLKDLFYLSRAKYIINNFRFHLFFKKKKNQIYIQMWHGGPIPQKKIEADAGHFINGTYLKMAKNDSKYIDYLLAGSVFINKIFPRAFILKGKMLNVGTPRYDKILNSTQIEKKQLRKKFGISEDEKVILYAPTFRNNVPIENLLMDEKKIIDAFEKRFNSKVKFLYRFHPNQAKESEKLKLTKNNVIDVTNYPDPIDIELISDILITDFSSVLSDFFVMKKPCLLYIKDLENYKNTERDLYLNPFELPYKIFDNQNDMTEFILKNDELFDEEKYEKFKEKIGLTENGNACEKIYKIVFK